MKRMLSVVLFVFISVALHAQFTKASLQASGLTCAMCSKAVKVALEKIPFVQEVKVDIKNQQYNLVFKEGNNVDFDALSKAVEDAGFSVASLKATGNFSNVKAVKDSHAEVAGLNLHFLNGNDENLVGERTITIVDKNFLSAKAFKKYASESKHACVQTGKADDCCKKEGVAANARVYHVII
jgi:copper chaperone CopZ